MKKLISILSLLFITFFCLNCNKTGSTVNTDNQQPYCWDITDWSGLMSDVQLTSTKIPLIPLVDTSYTIWLKNKYNTVDLRSLTSDNFADLQCLKQYLDNKTLVQLGESSHGTKQYSQIKVRLIKFLHEQMGFDVIAFESGFFECYMANQYIAQTPEIQTMQNSIFYSVWGTEEVKELFTYIKATQSTGHPLILSGFDCQFSSYSIITHPPFLYEILSKINVEYAAQQRIFDLNVINKINNIAYLTLYYDSIKSTYHKIADYIDNHYQTLLDSFPQTPLYPAFLKQSIFSILSNVDVSLNNDTTLSGNPEAYRIRDSAMASNVVFLKNILYPSKKIILWAHNYHIGNSAFHHALSPDIKNMGIYLKDIYDNELYTIGLYMLKGKTKTDWNWTVIDIPLPATSSSLEAILYSCRKKSFFIDLMNHPYFTGNRWQYTPVTAKTSGFADEQMVIRNVYDGIIFIDSSSVPSYLK